MWTSGYPIPSFTQILLVIVAVLLARRLLPRPIDEDGSDSSDPRLVDDELTRLDDGEPPFRGDAPADEERSAYLPSGPERWILLLVLAGLIREPFVATLDWRGRILRSTLDWSRPTPAASAWSLLPYLPVLAFFLGLLLVGRLRPGYADIDRRRARLNALLALLLAGFWLPLVEQFLGLRELFAMIMMRSGDPRRDPFGGQIITMTQLMLLLFALGIGAWACYRTATWLNHGYKRAFQVGWRRKAGWLLGIGMWAAVAQGVMALATPMLSAAWHFTPVALELTMRSDSIRVRQSDALWAVLVQLLGMATLLILGAVARPVLDRTLARWAEPLPDPLDLRLIKELAAIGLVSWPVTWLTPLALWLAWGRPL